MTLWHIDFHVIENEWTDEELNLMFWYAGERIEEQNAMYDTPERRGYMTEKEFLKSGAWKRNANRPR